MFEKMKTIMIGSYHAEHASSRPITEAKLRWAPPVLWSEMTWEAGVTYRFARCTLGVVR